jgi:hypothetical protein
LCAGGWVLTGSATDAGCVGTSGRRSPSGKVRRVQVSLVRAVKRGRCRYLGAGGTLTGTVPCAEGEALVATGTAHFRLSVKLRIPAGDYRLLVQAIDASGNLEAAKARTVRVTKTAVRVVR